MLTSSETLEWPTCEASSSNITFKVSVSNLDLKPIFLRRIFIVCNLGYFTLTVMYFVFSLTYDCKALLISICKYALYKLVNYY